MIVERVITWGKGKRRPSAINATKTVKGQLFGKQIETDADRIYIAYSEKHWIEVIMVEGSISVVTREVDRETEIQAERLAWALCRAHGGDYTPPDENEEDLDADDWDEDYFI